MKKSKKIVFKVFEFPHFSETFIVAQIITAIKQGYDVQILVHKITNINPDLCSGLIAEYGLLDKIIFEDYKIPENKFLRLLKWIQILILNLKDFPSITRYYKEHAKFSLSWLFEWFFYKKLSDITIFHVQYGTNSNVLSALKKIGFKPILIVTFHGHDAFFPIGGYIQNNGYYDNLFKYADLITANTPYLGDKLLDLGCPIERLELIPVSVDTAFFHQQKNNKQSITHLKLITVGRLDKVKGQIFCIEALNILIQKGFKVSLTIIGAGSEQRNLESLIAKYNLKDSIFLKGSMSQEEIRLELWKHDVYLLTGQATTSGLRETQGLATLEAQACGLPAIVFDSGGIKYTVNNGISGFVCNEFDVDAVASNIIKFIEDPILLNEMSNQAVVFANENFSRQIIDQKWGLIYKRLS
ncbi:glycosyltransferase [Flavobacterium sp. 245]|uniref:glycosyltransferase n=1 Tax=Flavobacterium sp. 245 TaxID=2512115 RepID=UPI00105EC04E|nr:glycosyltransferase [Flavobacterium sp. 245]TDP00876.1 colanic acid/amylovoran biosynthesis glycosyltransferase [Flavobacterium sp. 245]